MLVGYHGNTPSKSDPEVGNKSETDASRLHVSSATLVMNGRWETRSWRAQRSEGRGQRSEGSWPSENGHRDTGTQGPHRDTGSTQGPHRDTGSSEPGRVQSPTAEGQTLREQQRGQRRRLPSHNTCCSSSSSSSAFCSVLLRAGRQTYSSSSSSSSSSSRACRQTYSSSSGGRRDVSSRSSAAASSAILPSSPPPPRGYPLDHSACMGNTMAPTGSCLSLEVALRDDQISRLLPVGL
ncbi:hypothetical protein EYF80_054761 [Liparis tanakae]|uniref:Uncharacterized protein n=1 Tax=Liparis tanakae TaxID=230148 RepID=A0A4Z2F1Q5_9TELE|nr:hypothetical protein EYF80_054761 [Liparis tanakae]